MSQDPNQHLDATRWLDGVELTADRLGLLCSNDLAQSVAAMKNMRSSIGKLNVDKFGNSLYSVSPEYMSYVLPSVLRSRYERLIPDSGLSVYRGGAHCNLEDITVRAMRILKS